MIKIKRRGEGEGDEQHEKHEKKQLSPENKETLDLIAGKGPVAKKIVEGMDNDTVIEDVEDREQIQQIQKPKVSGGRKLAVDFVKHLIESPCFMLSLGASKSGKTYALKSLLSLLIHKRQFFKRGLIFEGSKGLNDDWEWLPDSCRLGTYSERAMEIILARLRTEKEQLKKEGKAKAPPMFLIFDDCLGMLVKSQMFQNFLALYRHYNIWIFINNQYLATGIPIMREQTTHAIMYDTDRGLKGYYSDFGLRYSHSFAEFQDMFRTIVAKKHDALLFIAGEKKENNYVRYRAPPDFEPIPVYFTIHDTHDGRPHPKLVELQKQEHEKAKANEDSDDDSVFDG